MTTHSRAARARAFAPILLAATGSAAGAQAPQSGFDEIIVTAPRRADDPTRIAPDAEALLQVAGTVNDPIQALLTLPGIGFGGSDIDRPVVRGAGPDDNLYLVDGIVVPDLFHSLGDSIVNPAILRSFDLSSAAFPLRFGDATGGVIDVALRAPARDRAHVAIDASQLKSGAMVDVPLTETVGGYVAYRENLAHLFLANLQPSSPTVEFRMPRSRDYAAKLMWRTSAVEIGATALGAWDLRREVQRAALGQPIRFGQAEVRRFDAQSLRIHVDRPGFEWTATLAHIETRDGTDFAGGARRALSGEGWAFRGEARIPLGAIDLTAGVNARIDRYRLDLRGTLPLCDYLETRCFLGTVGSAVSRVRRFRQIEGYAGLRLPIGAQVHADLGGRIVHEGVLAATAFEPRLTVEWAPSEGRALFARIARSHRRPDAERLLLNLDNIDGEALQASWQGVLGARARFAGGWRFQIEGWYKDFRIRDLANTPVASDIDGNAHGIDLLIAYAPGRHFEGWLSMSHAVSRRDLHPDRRAIAYRYETPWSATLAGTWHIGGGWSFGGKARVQSGVRYTPLLGIVVGPPGTGFNPVYGAPFAARAPVYARLDLRLEKRFRLAGADARVYLDALNILDRTNIGERSYPARNAFADSSGTPMIAPDNESGVPRFVAIGLGIDF